MHTSIEKINSRRQDFELYVYPQKKEADMIISFFDDNNIIKLKIFVRRYKEELIDYIRNEILFKIEIDDKDNFAYLIFEDNEIEQTKIINLINKFKMNLNINKISGNYFGIIQLVCIHQLYEMNKY